MSSATSATSCGLRTNHRDETVFLYRINTSAENARRLFMVYLERINELADRPEFYHLLSNSCTINIVRYANAAGRRGSVRFPPPAQRPDRRLSLRLGPADTTLPFLELRRRSLINGAAQAADGLPDFSERIRASLPTIPH